MSASYRPPLAMARYDLATTEQLMAHLRFNIVKKYIYHDIFMIHLSHSSKLKQATLTDIWILIEYILFFSKSS